ncbi:PfkB family carbohydrate kinase [Desulfobulbus oligotrophicus]|jgi:sugar/nucleoside kinase (ribokinase family)|uniref:Sugar kinase n=1 Tax=Desulfobulbus oligotrophicus TaxID=1909699 RepID=A0A7T6AQJ3_9BACT|nr:PfkB family carbohydrate kinase [Desulfobulbus oligotrophicus]MDY0391356.1 PfkB family carbohydrate kinase [Desulfobulbus oligotrophicus]QQG65602.1 sugar kinase [Desulfobulbus oligotrophicus]
MHKGTFLGLATADTVYYVPHFLERNQKLKAERQLAYAGGPATNAAVAFAAFGNESTLLTGLGQHPMAHIAKVDLADHKVRLIDCTDQPRRPPILSTIIVDLSCGERSVVYSSTDLRKLRSDTINKNTLEYSDVLLLDGYYLPQAIQLATLAKKLKIPVVFDGGSWKDGLENLLPLVDYAICSNAFFLPGSTNQEGLTDFLQQQGIQCIAITRDGQPIIAHCQGQTREIPVMQVKTVDTLGAGDIFHGAFCHYILECDFLLSLERSGEVASLSCTSLGTRAWIEQEKFL